MRLLGVTYQQVQKYERGSNRIGSSRLHDLCRILAVPVSYFFDQTPAPAGLRRRQRVWPRLRPRSSMRRRCVPVAAGGPRDPGARSRLQPHRRPAGTPATARADPGAGRHGMLRAGTQPAERLDPRLALAVIAAHHSHLRMAVSTRAIASPCRCHKILRAWGAPRLWPPTITCSPASPFPKATPTRSATGSRTRSSTSICGEYPFARVACETLATTNRVVIAGEVRPGPEQPDHARPDRACRPDGDQGYRLRAGRLPLAQCQGRGPAARAVAPTSPWAWTPASKKEEGAGDQGIMFGYATAETPALMPAPIQYAHELLRRLAADRHSGTLAQLGPDAKSQFTLRYVDGTPGRAPPRSCSRPSMSTATRPRTSASSSGPTCRPSCPRAGCARRPSSTSIRPATSSSAGPTVMPA